MYCEWINQWLPWGAIGALAAVAALTWLTSRVRQRLRNCHPDLWTDLNTTVLPVRKRLANGTRFFLFILLGRYWQLEDPALVRASIGMHFVLVLLLAVALLLKIC